jgi:hypothetical protein
VAGTVEAVGGGGELSGQCIRRGGDETLGQRVGDVPIARGGEDGDAAQAEVEILLALAVEVARVKSASFHAYEMEMTLDGSAVPPGC